MPETRLLYLHALTGLHPGSGAALGTIDLPVQRERHTRWPLIPGSSLKGVLRAATRPTNGVGHHEWLTVFGPETANASDHAGALSLTDARILAFPVRSLRGIFAWVTCPAVLARFTRDAALAGKEGPPEVRPVEDGKASAGTALQLPNEKKIILEEFDFDVADTVPEAWAQALAAAVPDEETKKRIKSHLVILSDNDFQHFVEHATEVTARIGLDPETKTVKGGALFYQEVLPPESLFYALVFAEDGRRGADGKGRKAEEEAGLKAGAVIIWVGDQIAKRRVIQIGGDESIGRGLCAVTLA